MTLRRLRPRAAAPALLAGALVCFLFPWLTVTADLRRADATGLELVTGHVDYSGRYVHDAWRGEVEAVVHGAHLWAPPAFVAIAVALVLVLLPWRPAWWTSLAASVAAVVLLAVWIQATSVLFNPPDPDRLWGFWAALVLTALALVPIVARLREPATPAAYRRPPEWLTRSGAR